MAQMEMNQNASQSSECEEGIKDKAAFLMPCRQHNKQLKVRYVHIYDVHENNGIFEWARGLTRSILIFSAPFGHFGPLNTIYNFAYDVLFLC